MTTVKDRFDEQLLLRVGIKVKNANEKVRWIGLTYLTILLLAACLGLVVTIEWEMLFRFFLTIGGENNEYWSPGKMAMTGAIVLIAAHLLSDEQRRSFIMRLVRILTPFLVGLYLIGLGLLMSGILSLDTIAFLLSPPIDIGGLLNGQPDQPWLISLFEHLITPTAILLFSCGVGGLAVVNIFVATELLAAIKRNIRKVRDTKSEADWINGRYAALQTSRRKRRETQQALAELALWTPARILSWTALQLADLVQEAAARHKRHLKHKELEPRPTPITLTDPIDTKVIEREMKRIDALDVKAITRILKTHQTSEV